MTEINYDAEQRDRTPPGEPSSSGSAPRMLDLALRYARRGWRVFPVRPPRPDGTCSCGSAECTSPGKHPAVKKWQDNATTDEARIRLWWDERPQHNIGIATGTGSNLLVLDADGAIGRESLQDREMPKGAPTVTTGRVDGGTHFYLACPEALDARNFAGKIPGIDARANGGFVVAAGSLHASGARYMWIGPPTDDPLPMPPAWLVDLLKEAKRSPGPISLFIPKNRRNVELTRLAGVFRRQGLDTDEILTSLRATNAKRCQPPLADDEVETIAASIGRRDATSPLITASRDDLGNAERFAFLNYGQALWVEEQEHWIVWDGKRWARSKVALDRLTAATARAYQIEAARLPLGTPDRDQHLEHAARLQRADALRHMVRWAQPELSVRMDELDRHPWLLNCANGTIHLWTGELRPHDPADLLTRVIDVTYDPGAGCIEWDRFLERAMTESPEVLVYLQRLAGIFLTGDVTEKILPIIWGLRDTGKSVFTNIIRRLLGEYAQVMSEATLAAQQRKGGGNEASPDIARLVGIRLVVVSETAADFRLNEGRIKAWTGRTPQTARHLHGNPFDFEPTHKLLIETNNRPLITGGDEATWGRVQLIPFTEVIPVPEQNRHLEDLLAEEFPGILAWMVRGCLDWRANGLQVPGVVQAETEKYQESQDPLQDFFEARCVMGEDRAAAKADVWAAYADWSKGQGGYSLGKQRFNALLETHGFTEFRDGKNSNTRSWRGIGLKKITSGPEETFETKPGFFDEIAAGTR